MSDVNQTICSGNCPADELDGVNLPDRDRQLKAIQPWHPYLSKQRSSKKQIHIQHPVQHQVECTCGVGTSPGFKVVNACKTMLLHDAVLVVPEYDDDDGRQWSP